MEKQKGLYLGTEIGETWWKRYTHAGFFMRGNGTYWMDDKGFFFQRYPMKEPFFIPFGSMLEIKSGTWHSGRWAFGNLIVKIIWQKDNLRLSSGFIVSGNRQQTLKTIEFLRTKCGWIRETENPEDLSR